MYYQHFGLSGAPFEFNPSVSALFMSAGHREGLAALEWGLLEPSGFTMLVGEIGTGKTTLIYSLLATQHGGVRTVWLANPRLSFEQMLRQILGQLGASQSETSDKLTLLQAFDAQLASLGRDECIAVILDEAQYLSDDALEDLRLLSNFQALERRRLQIVLVGQIDLVKRLAGPQLRQLDQRIGARALLPTLARSEIHDYLDYRLRSRGGDVERLFTRGAIRELARASAGIPRRINILCHNALLLAYAQEKSCVTAQNVRDAAHDYDHLLVSRASVPAKMATSASAALPSARESMRLAGARLRRMATTVATMGPAMRSVTAVTAGTLAALGLLGIAVLGFSALRPERANLPALAAPFAPQSARQPTSILVERSPAPFPNKSYGTATPPPKTAGLAQGDTHDRSAASANEAIMSGPAKGSSTIHYPVPNKQQSELSGATDTKSAKPSSSAHIAAAAEAPVEAKPTVTRPGRTVVVRAGDTLSKIATRLYGSFGSDELSRLTAANPQITNADLIYPGQSIHVQRADK